MALMAPGVRTVVVPKQRGDLTIVVPPCNATQVDQESTEIPPGSNQIIVPEDTLAQTVAIQPCLEGQKQTGQGTILMTPGGAGQAAQQQTQQGQAQQQNQLVIPDNSDLQRVIVPACQVIMSSSSSSSSSSGGGDRDQLARVAVLRRAARGDRAAVPGVGVVEQQQLQQRRLIGARRWLRRPRRRIPRSGPAAPTGPCSTSWARSRRCS